MGGELGGGFVGDDRDGLHGADCREGVTSQTASLVFYGANSAFGYPIDINCHSLIYLPLFLSLYRPLTKFPIQISLSEFLISQIRELIDSHFILRLCLRVMLQNLFDCSFVVCPTIDFFVLWIAFPELSLPRVERWILGVLRAGGELEKRNQR